MPAVGSVLANALTAAPARPQAPVAKAAPAASGAMPGDTALFGYHRQRKASSKTLTFPMAEAARLFGLMPSPANMQAWGAWFNQCDRPGVIGPKTFAFSKDASITKESPNIPATVLKVQQGLARRGYPVQPSGTYDAATERAIVAFKKAQGLHDGWRTADQQPAFTPFADERVQAAIARL